MKVKIEYAESENWGWGPPDNELRVYVDGEQLPLVGYFGGEPEDNTRGRTYRWVDSLLSMLADRLGAEVEMAKVVLPDDE